MQKHVSTPCVALKRVSSIRFGQTGISATRRCPDARISVLT